MTSQGRGALVLTLMVLVALAAWAQGQCFFCKGNVDLRPVPYADQTRQVCEKCRSRLPHCSICGLPASLPKHRDGRVFCVSCHNLGIFKQPDLDRRYGEVLTFIRTTLGGIDLKPPPQTMLVDQDELQTKFSESGRSMDVAGFYRPYNPEMIYVLSGYPPLETGAVMVHEYTHAWQSRNCPQQDRALVEGFASWVEYKYLLSQGQSARAQALKHNRDPDYGASLVKLLDKEKQLGSPKALIDWVLKNRNL